MLSNTGVASIQRAVMVLHEMSADEKIQEEARMREKALHIEASEIGSARRAGKAEGIAEGKVEGRVEGRAEERANIIAKMKAKGMTDEEIRNLIG